MVDAPLAVDEETALLDELARLIERCGIEPFVAAPLLEADDRFFPDEWHANDASVGWLARRLLDYAGLGSYGVTVELASNSGEAPEAAVWFAGLDGTTCRFGTALTQLDDALLVVATMAHEVARAYRAIRRLDDTSASASHMVSLTTIYLGFGILTTNASYRYRTKGELIGSLAYTEWSHQRFGGLSPQAMSFLLAVQLAARDAKSSQIRSIADQLEPNQRAYFENAYGNLMPDTAAERLRLPDRASWPPQRPLPPKAERKLVRSFVEAAGLAANNLASAAVVKGRTHKANSGRATFRVVGTTATTWMMIGLGVAVAGALVAAWIASHFVSGPPLAWVDGWAVGAWFMAWPIIGFALGKTRRRDHCSDASCNAVLPLSASVCPGCGGNIAETIKNRNERLDAEERLRVNRADYEIDVGSESAKLARGARPLFAPPGIASGLIGADVHEGDDDEPERGTSSTVVRI